MQIASGFLAVFLIEAALIFFLHVLPRRQQRWIPISKPSVPDEVKKSFEAASRKRLVGGFSTSLHYFDAYADGESCVWVNAILARLFCQLSDGFYLSNLVARKIGVELREVFQTWFGCLILVRCISGNSGYLRMIM